MSQISMLSAQSSESKLGSVACSEGRYEITVTEKPRYENIQGTGFYIEGIYNEGMYNEVFLYFYIELKNSFRCKNW